MIEFVLYVVVWNKVIDTGGEEILARAIREVI